MSCASARPTRLAWSDIELGHPCGPRAKIELALDRSCTLAYAANREPVRHAALDRARCDRIFAMAAHRGSEHPSCTVPQPFDAGVTITIDRTHARYACWDDPLASQLAELATQLVPDWRDGRGMSQQCDFN